jgi:WD40 repeat protein
VTNDVKVFSTSSMDGCIRTFDTTSCKLISTIASDPGQVRKMNLNHFTAFDAIISFRTGVFDTIHKILRCLLLALRMGSFFCVFAINCFIMARFYMIRSVNLWDMRSNGLQAPINVHTFDTKAGFGYCVNWRHDGNALAVGSSNGSITVLDTRNFQPLYTLSSDKAHSKLVRSIAFSRDGLSLCSGSDDLHVMAFEARHGQRTMALTGHVASVLGISIHPDSKHLASCGSDRKIKLWDLGTQECVHTFDVHRDQVWAVEFSPDGSKLASVGDDANLHIATTQFER